MRIEEVSEMLDEMSSNLSNLQKINDINKIEKDIKMPITVFFKNLGKEVSYQAEGIKGHITILQGILMGGRYEPNNNFVYLIAQKGYIDVTDTIFLINEEEEIMQ